MKKYSKRMGLLFIILALVSGMFMPAHAQASTGETAHKTVRVAMLNYPNFIDYDQKGNPSGFACDYLDEIAKYTGWDYEYIPVSFKDAQKMLEEGTLDIIPGTQYTEERDKLYDFGEISMMQDSNVLCVPVDDTSYYYNDFSELEGKKIGVMTGSLRKQQFAEVLAEKGISVQFVEFDTNEEEKVALSDGRVSAILMSMLRCTQDYRIIASTNPTEVYFTMNANDPTIKEGIDQAQHEILSANPYFGLELSQKHYGNVLRAYAFTDEERDFMESSPAITIAVSTDMNPMEYYDADSNSFKGLVIDYFDKISEITGLEFQYVERGDKDETIEALDKDTIQLLGTATEGINLEDTFPITLTDSYIQSSVSLVYNEKVENPLSKENHIALKSGFIYFQNLANEQEFSDITMYDTFTECVEAVNKGKADVTYLPGYSVSRITGHASYRNIKVLPSEIASYDCAIGVSNQCDPLLVSVLNKALSTIPSSEKESMLLSAVSTNMDDKTLKDIFYENLTTILCIIVFLSILTGIVGVRVSIRRKKTNKKLSEAMLSVENANAAKTDFMSRMSHDMRTPMNGILGIADLSEDETDVSVLKDNMNKIRQSGQYLLCLINDTLDFQKIESGRLALEPEIVSTRELVTNVLMMVQMDAKKKDVEVQLITEGADLDGLVKVDPVRMKQIFFNLLSNAVKFTPAGGKVKVDFKCIGHTGNVAHDVISISDTGIGMSKDFIENRIFQPFSQEHSEIVSNYSGSGLGLSIAKRLVEMMNGSISVESELGEGTTFTVKIDFERADEGEAESYSHQTEIRQEKVEDALKGRHILLAEDHPLNAEIAKRLLEKAGCIVEWKEDGRKCLDCFAASEEKEFDVILMDIRMPNMDGIAAAKEIRKLSREDAATIPIIAMTANAYDSDIQNCLDAGMNAHIAKPIDPKTMYETIAMRF